MTVSAIIPGAVMALAILRPFKGTILEVNLATMGAAAGECIAAGVIFTIPALVILGAWTEIHYIETTLIALLGGLIGWVIILPIVILIGGMPAGNPLDGVFLIWGDQIRYIGVGAMLVGGLWAIWQIKNNLVDSVREAIIGIRGGDVKTKKRTDQDISYKFVFSSIVLITIPVFLLYLWLSDLFGISLFMALITIAFAFLAGALAGYLTGLVGSSNCPISGVTVVVLLIVSLIMLGLGQTTF